MDEVATLGAQLLMLVRGFYYEGWHPADKPFKERKQAEFLGYIYKAFRDDFDVDCEQVARGVFQVLSKHMTAGEIHGVKQALGLSQGPH